MAQGKTVIVNADNLITLFIMLKKNSHFRDEKKLKIFSHKIEKPSYLFYEGVSLTSSKTLPYHS